MFELFIFFNLKKVNFLMMYNNIFERLKTKNKHILKINILKIVLFIKFVL